MRRLSPICDRSLAAAASRVAKQACPVAKRGWPFRGKCSMIANSPKAFVSDGSTQPVCLESRAGINRRYPTEASHAIAIVQRADRLVILNRTRNPRP